MTDENKKIAKKIGSVLYELTKSVKASDIPDVLSMAFDVANLLCMEGCSKLEKSIYGPGISNRIS